MAKFKEYQWHDKRLKWKAMWSDRITWGGLVVSLIMMWGGKNSPLAFAFLGVGLSAGIYGYYLKNIDKKLKWRAMHPPVKVITLPEKDLQK